MSPSRAVLLALLCVAGAAHGQAQPQPPERPPQPPADYGPYPQPGAGYVTDLAGLLSEAEEERIEQWLWQVETRSQVEIIVVTVRSMRDYPGAQTGSIEDFARGLFDTYKIGNLPANDGVLLVVSSEDRKARIELGAGHGRFRDADAQRIMDDVIVPAFRKGDFAGGITDGVQALAGEFAGLRIGFPWRLVGLFGGALVLALVGFSLLKSGKRGWGWVFLGLALVVLLTALFVLFTILRYMPRTRSRGWASGGSGGFGGGFSGGGGASGSW